LFDDIHTGINFKASFLLDSENIFQAMLSIEGEYCPPVSDVPIPAAAFLFAPALLAFMGLRRKAKNSVRQKINS